MKVSYDLVVLGAGVGGYVAAVRAAQLGLKVGIIEKDAELGGTCLRVGCIPSKVLLEASERYHDACHGLGKLGIEVGQVSLDLPKMLANKDAVVKSLTQGVAYLMRKNKIARHEGYGRFLGPRRVLVEAADGPVEVEGRHVLIATGSSPATLPGVHLDGDRICSSTEALCFPEVPEHLIVIGAGFIGLELGSVWSRLGSKVTVLEFMDRILPGTDAELAAEARKVLERQGLAMRLGARVSSAANAGDHASVTIDGGETLACTRVLVAVGRRPNTQGMGLLEAGVEVDERGRVVVDEHLRTSADGVYAVGDVVAGPMLAHKAEEEGVAAAEHIVTGYGHVDYGTIPAVAYTHPEIASVGRTEEELARAGIEYRKGSFPFMANGRAKALGQTQGRVKVLADSATDRELWPSRWP